MRRAGGTTCIMAICMFPSVVFLNPNGSKVRSNLAVGLRSVVRAPIAAHEPGRRDIVERLDRESVAAGKFMS
jgi:hypothetical protein